MKPSKPVLAEAWHTAFYTILFHLASFLSSQPDWSLFPTLVHSPMNLMGTGRHSSSSLSSHASSEAGNVVMLGDSSVGEAPEDLYHHMQVPELPEENGQGTVRTRLSAGWSGVRAGISSPVSELRTPRASKTAFPSHHPVSQFPGFISQEGNLASFLVALRGSVGQTVLQIALLPGIPDG